MSSKILNIATFGLAGALLGGHKKAAPAPTPVPEPTMPMPDDAEVQRARRRSLIQQMGRGGRTSTMLTDQSDTLGN